MTRASAAGEATPVFCGRQMLLAPFKTASSAFSFSGAAASRCLQSAITLFRFAMAALLPDSAHLLLLLLLPFSKVLGIPEALLVSLSGGRIQGALHEGAVRFLGIPYSNAQRFQVPTMMEPQWPGILNATTPPPQCLQRCPPVIQDLHCQHASQMDERCLYLNIYRPAYNLPAGQTFPVMVYIHGGDFQSGSGAAPLYDGSFLAKRGAVIVVTMNYRLGAFGFLPIFNKYDDVIGNFGLQDQQVALQWIHNNIASFDGNPAKVTLFGADAGCQSVGLHLASPAANSFFQAAILHSCPFTQPFRNKTESRRMVQEFAAALGCQENDVNCYRQKSADDVLQAEARVGEALKLEPPAVRLLQIWGPVMDYSLVHEHNLLGELFYAVSPSGRHVKPMLIGFVEEEAATAVYRRYPLPVPADFFRRLLENSIRGNVRELVEGSDAPYLPKLSTDAREEMVRFLDDFLFVCPVRHLAENLTSGGISSGRVWLYSFEPRVTWSPGGSTWPPGGETYCQTVACHGLDLLYLFNPPAVPAALRESVQELASSMASYWTNFARDGDPNRAPAAFPLHVTSSWARSGGVTGGVQQKAGQAPFPAFPSGPGAVPPSFLHPAHTRVPLPGPVNSLFSPFAWQRTQATQAARAAIAGSVPGAPASPHTLASGQWRNSLGPFTWQNSLGAPQHPQNAARVTHATSPSPPPAGTTNGSVYWPSYSDNETLKAHGVKITMVLTQPKAVLRQSAYDARCQLWDRLGYK